MLVRLEGEQRNWEGKDWEGEGEYKEGEVRERVKGEGGIGENKERGGRDWGK